MIARVERDGQLLARNLEDERREGVEGRKLVHPRPRTKVGPRVDQPCEDRVRLPKKLACIGVGLRARLRGVALTATAKIRCA